MECVVRATGQGNHFPVRCCSLRNETSSEIRTDCSRVNLLQTRLGKSLSAFSLLSRLAQHFSEKFLCDLFTLRIRQPALVLLETIGLSAGRRTKPVWQAPHSSFPLPDHSPSVWRSRRLFYVSFVVSRGAATTVRADVKMSFAMDLLFLPCFVSPTLRFQTQRQVPSNLLSQRATLKRPLQDGRETQIIAESWPAPWRAQTQPQGDCPCQQRHNLSPDSKHVSFYDFNYVSNLGSKPPSVPAFKHITFPKLNLCRHGETGICTTPKMVWRES